MKFIALPSLCLAAGVFFGTGAASTVRAQDTVVPTFLHGFDGTRGSDLGQLVAGGDGYLYGTTAYGGFGYNANIGQSGAGIVYRVAPTGDYATLYAFPGGTFGSNPHGLIRGMGGNFYGLTSHGGAAGDGTIFRLTPAGELTTVYNFTDNTPTDEPLVQDDSGNFYGVRSANNVTNRASIFRLSATGEYTTLYAFTGGSDGRQSTGLVKGPDGNFYGTSSQGEGGGGGIYQITPAGGFTVLHAFTNADYIFQSNGLTLGSDGDFYGTTANGGANSKGEVFRVTPAGGFTVLYSFTGGSDGEYPGGRLAEGRDGNFYGLASGTLGSVSEYQPARATAARDSAPDAIIAPPLVPQTVYRITPQGVVTPLYATSKSTFTGLTLGDDGNFYTSNGFYGTVFQLTIVPHPAFFADQAPLADGTYYLSFANGNYFGYYAFTNDQNVIYHLDLGPESLFDADDGQGGLYLYDFRSRGFFYTSPTFPFPYLYDFSLNTVLYYFPDPDNAGRYNTNGTRYFYRFDTGQIITK